MNKIDMQKFCDNSDTRGLFNEPFSDDRYTYATNKMIAIRTQRIQEETVSVPAELRELKSWNALPWDHGRITEWRKIKCEFSEEKEVTCNKCAGTGMASICEDCDGEGGVEYVYKSRGGFSYTKDFECPICIGSGTVNGGSTRCDKCFGKGAYIEPTPIKLMPIGVFVRSDLLRLIKDLPDVMVALDNPRDKYTPRMILFRFDGGEGMLVPMNRFRE